MKIIGTDNFIATGAESPLKGATAHQRLKATALRDVNLNLKEHLSQVFLPRTKMLEKF